MTNTFAIGIPTLNRYDLLKEALAKYYIDFPNIKIYIVDNGSQGIDYSHPNINIYIPSQNLGVASSWNILLNEIFIDHSHALILNDDIILSRTQDEIQNLIDSNINQDFFVSPGTWCSFILPKKTFEKVGYFDEEFFPAYWEDNSYHYRLQLANCTYFQTEVLFPKIYRNSQTIAKDKAINKNFEALKALYIKMWGGLPGEEKFITKYNRNI